MTSPSDPDHIDKSADDSITEPSDLSRLPLSQLLRIDRTLIFSVLPIPFISIALERDERLGILVAAIAGLYVLFLTRKRARLRWLLLLFGTLFFGGAILGLITGSARIFFATDPIEDFVTSAFMFGSIFANRPLAGLLMEEMFPAVRGNIQSETKFLKQVTAVIGCVNLSTGIIRTALLLSSIPVEYFVLISRPIAFAGSGITVLLGLWLLRKRRMEG
jgi:hypothetical protein